MSACIGECRKRSLLLLTYWCCTRIICLSNLYIYYAYFSLLSSSYLTVRLRKQCSKYKQRKQPSNNPTANSDAI